MNNGYLKAQWHCGRQGTSDECRKNWMRTIENGEKRQVGRGTTWALADGE